MKRKIDTNKHIIVFIISFFVFVSGLYFGFMIANTKISLLDEKLSDLEIGLTSPELQFVFKDVMGQELSCPFFEVQLYDITKRTNTLAQEITEYEDSRNPLLSDKNFIALKSRYTLALLRNWMYMEKVKKICDSNYTTVLYFYTWDCDKCPLQGFYLSYYKKIAPNDLMIFALQADLDVAVVEALALNYNITEYPSLVINGKNVHSGFFDKDALKEIFCKTTPGLSFCEG